MEGIIIAEMLMSSSLVEQVMGNQFSFWEQGLIRLQ
jgi:hypothetical protein